MPTQRLVLTLVTVAAIAAISSLPLGVATAQAADEHHLPDETPSAMTDGANMTQDELQLMCMTPMDTMGMMHNATPGSMMRMCMMQVPPGMGNASDEDLERMFLMRMTMHHRAAVAMADLAMDRAMHPELRDLARNISTTRSAEIENMTRWLREWHNTTPPHDTMMDLLMQMQLAAMSNMTEADFERTFLDQMIMHHEAALNMSEPMMDRAPHAEAREAADEILTMQQLELDRMQAWRETGFEETSTATTPTTAPGGNPEAPRETPGPKVPIILLATVVLALISRRGITPRETAKP